MGSIGAKNDCRKGNSGTCYFYFHFHMVTGKIRESIEDKRNCGNCKGPSLEMRHVIRMRHNGPGLYGIVMSIESDQTEI